MYKTMTKLISRGLHPQTKPWVRLCIFNQPYSSLTGSYEKLSISRDQVVNWGQMYSSNIIFDFLLLGFHV